MLVETAEDSLLNALTTRLVEDAHCREVALLGLYEVPLKPNYFMML